MPALDWDAIKIVLDIGLGALSLLLWLRQGKVNKLQVDLDTKQNIATENLAILVRDHDARIARLEQVDILASASHKAATRRKSGASKKARS